MISRVVLATLLLVAHAAFAAPAPRCEPPRPQARAFRNFDPAAVRAFDAAIRAELAQEPFAGMSVGITQGDRAWFSAYGHRDLKRRLPATPETTYRYASITKSFTAVAVMQLVERGALELDDEISELVPTYPKKPWPITVEQLLGHLSGVPHYANRADGANVRRVDTEGAIALFADRPLAAEPGTDFVYTTWGYNLLGAAIERVTGQSYGDHLSRHLFLPAGMTSAALDDHRRRGANHAVGYRRRGGRIVPSEFLDVSSRFAGGGTRGSVRDLIAFGRGLLDDRFVSRDTARRMMTPMQTKDGRLIDYGMGFATFPLRGHYMVTHAGGQPETTTLLVVVPAAELVIALASNLEGEAGLHKRITSRVIEQLFESGRVRRDVYAADPIERIQYEGLYRVFTYGVAYEAWSRALGAAAPSSPDPAIFQRAESLLSRTRLGADPIAALEAIRTAHEPRGERLFIELGEHMARTIGLARGTEHLARMPEAGPLHFFADYFAACETLKCAPSQRLASLQSDVRRYLEAWERSELSALTTLRLDEAARPEALWPELEKQLAGSGFHPDYSEELLRLAKRTGSASWLERAVQMHPRAPEALMALADHKLSNGFDEAALQLYQRAAEADPARNSTSPEALLQRAQRERSRQVTAGILRFAANLHPDRPELWAALSRAERRLGRIAESKRAQEEAARLQAAVGEP